jgi:hypothetical protein
MVTSEPDKYDITKFFKKPSIVINLDIMDERNGNIDASTLIQDNSYKFQEGDITEIVSAIDFGDLNGLAMFYVVMSYNKVDLKGYYYLVLYDIDNSELLFVKPYNAKPKGFGLRNFWAKTYHLVLKEASSDINI